MKITFKFACSSITESTVLKTDNLLVVPHLLSLFPSQKPYKVKGSLTVTYDDGSPIINGKFTSCNEARNLVESAIERFLTVTN